MSTLLIKDADLVVTMDDERQELPSCDVLVRDNAIAEVGPNLDAEADETIDARGCIVIPGLINSHNHMWGTLYRAWPELQDVHGDDWFAALARVWEDSPLTPDALYTAALANMGQHVITGGTMSADHHWVYRKGVPKDFVDRSIDAAREIGLRFHPSRGCMTLGQEAGGNMPDFITEPEDVVMNHAQELIDRYHDPGPHAMVRIHLSPTGVYSDSETIFKEMRALCDATPGTKCKVHIYHGDGDKSALERYGVPAMQVLERCGWEGPDVMYYHFDTHDADERRRAAEARTWISVCLAVDLRMGFLGPGRGSMPRVREIQEMGGNVCFGTTNPANNEASAVLDDMRVCMLAQRPLLDEPERWLTARDVIWMATRGAALGLGADDVGMIAPGMAADLAVFNVANIDMAGHHDPVVFLYAHSRETKATIINGHVVARDGRLVNVDQDEIARNCNAQARKMVPR
jgi:cytosine/adenosine deaminase-related metal-dependent hydrolase